MASPSATFATGARALISDEAPRRLLDATSWPAIVLGLMMFLLPAVGVPSTLMLQDTLKSAVAVFGTLAVALLFFWQQRQRSIPLLWHGLVSLPLVLMLYALTSMVWSHSYLAAVEAVRWFVLGLLLWLGLNTLSRREHVVMLAWGIHGGAVVASLWVALQFWLDLDWFPQYAAPASTFINRNLFAEYAVCALPFSVTLLANLRASRSLALGLMAVTLAFNIVAVMMTGTRSALLTLLLLALVFIAVLYRYRHQFAFVRWGRSQQVLVGSILVVGVLGLGALPCGNARLLQESTGNTAWQRAIQRTASVAEPKEYSEGTFSMRTYMWRSTLRMIWAQPLTGVGAGAWEVEIPLYQGIDNSMEADYYAHNEWLQLLSEYGVLAGGLLLAILFAYWLLAAGRTWQLQGAARWEAPWRAAALSSLLALLLVGNAGFPLRLASTGAIFALSLAILAASDARLGWREAFFSAPLRWRPFFSQALLVLALGGTLTAAYITQQAVEVERRIMRSIQIGGLLARANHLTVQQTHTLKAELLNNMRRALAINPHYRKLTAEVADRLAASGDWSNTAWLLESIAASRPHVANIWAGITLAHIKLEEFAQASAALEQLQRLQPDSSRTQALQNMLPPGT